MAKTVVDAETLKREAEEARRIEVWKEEGRRRMDGWREGGRVGGREGRGEGGRE